MRVERAGAVTALAVCSCLLGAGSAAAQANAGPPSAAEAGAVQHVHPPAGGTTSGWTLMQDGIVFAELNHQGTPRGGTEFVVPNWWMGMATRETKKGQITLSGMLSLDPATVGREGYLELFQSGEALDGRPLIDRQHPHDLFMQFAAIWRVPINQMTGITIAGAPVGEPTLGPVAFMHRPSAADNPTAPLGHHTFDSTHVAFGVVTASVDRGRWVVEGSVFNGREPDDHRWDFDFGRLDSFAGRVWFKPTREWELQISSGKLTDPEQLEAGHDVVRSTASASWTRTSDQTMSAITVAVGRNNTDHGNRNAFLVEGARQARGNTLYGRFETLQVETALLETDHIAEGGTDLGDNLLAFTLGGVRGIWNWKGFEGGVGADVTVYGVPKVLQPLYSGDAFSFHIFFRLRPPAGAMGRMWNMRMSQPMTGHAGHQMMNHQMP